MHHQRSAWASSDDERASTRPARRGTSGSAHAGLDQRADQQAGVQHHHRPGSGRDPVSTPPRAKLQAALRLETTSSASRSRPTSTTSDRERGQRGHRGSAARSSTSSEQKPGPIAISSPWEPGRRRPVARGCPRGRAAPTPTTGCRSRPASPRSARRPRRSRPSVVLQRLDHLGAAGVADPPADVVAGQAVVGEEAVDVLADVARRSRRAPRRRARSAARVRRRRSPWSARSRGRAGCGCRATCAGAGRGRAGRAPAATTAEAPSPNSPLATRLGTETSSRCTVSEQSSTATSTATSSGWPAR